MRYFAIILVALLVLPVALAKNVEVTLKEKESYFYDGRNVTLLKLDKPDEKVIICLNNDKEIISDSRAMNGVNIRLVWVKAKEAKFELRFAECSYCEYGNWDNLDCFDECVSNINCDDNNEESVDNCRGRPKKCVNEAIEVIEEEEIENKTIEEQNNGVEFVRNEEKKYKSFTQWLFEKIKNLFRR